MEKQKRHALDSDTLFYILYVMPINLMLLLMLKKHYVTVDGEECSNLDLPKGIVQIF